MLNEKQNIMTVQLSETNIKKIESIVNWDGKTKQRNLTIKEIARVSFDDVDWRENPYVPSESNGKSGWLFYPENIDGFWSGFAVEFIKIKNIENSYRVYVRAYANGPNAPMPFGTPYNISNIIESYKNLSLDGVNQLIDYLKSQNSIEIDFEPTIPVPENMMTENFYK